MSNTILTPTAVTREALFVLHQNLNFVGNVNRQYDSSFAKSGAKIGDTLKIRLPNEYTVRTGATLQAQNTSETSVSLQVSTQKGVDINFTSAELTLDMQDFSERVLQPAMSVLAADIENDALSMYKDVYNEVSDVGASLTIDGVLGSQDKLTESLAPLTMRSLNMPTKFNSDLVSASTSLFNDRTKVSNQYRSGLIGNDFFGYDKVFQNTMMPTHTTGTDDGTGDHKVGAANQTGSSITHGSEGTGTLLTGDIISFAGCNRCHPETKADTGELMQFVVTSDMSGTDTTVSISPSIVTSGARQNVYASPTAGGAIWKRESDESTAIGASADYKIGLGYHRDAFAFATADLVMPEGVDFAARKVIDGISLRVVRQYDINNDNFPCRIDVMYGYKTLRGNQACRIGYR